MATRNLLFVAILSCLASAPAAAATYTINLTSNSSQIYTDSSNFNGMHFDSTIFPLDGIDSSVGIDVALGDMIHSTVTFDAPVTIPPSMVRTDFLQIFNSTTFPSGDTGVTGTFTLYSGGATVGTYGYRSTTSGQLASFAALFPPANGQISFDSFTNDFTITDLVAPANLQFSTFYYSLVSGSVAAVPEPATWAMMIAGFGLAGAAMRRRRAGKITVRYA